MSRLSSRGAVPGWVIAIVLVAISIVVVTQRQTILDYVWATSYKPTAAMVSIRNTLNLTTNGEVLFNASRPELSTSQEFNRQCKKREADSPILGCYVGWRFYMFDIDNQKLDGIEEVTAAHELLHAVYDRLSSSEREVLAAELEKIYSQVEDEELKTRMAYYARTEPGERINELHSIIGTEVKDISPALDEHYQKYFKNRNRIVSLYAQVEKVFSDLKQQADKLSAELDTLAASIEDDKASYDINSRQLSQSIDAYHSRAQTPGGFSSQAEADGVYNSLAGQSNALEAQRVAVNQKISRYNSLREQLQALAYESEALNKSIDSTLSPAPTVQ